jgi:hypothetical protein
MSQLQCEFKVLEDLPAGEIVEFIFKGKHESTHGREMGKYICDTLVSRAVAAIVVNLLDYEYRFGNDIGQLCVACFDQTRKVQRSGRIVATGKTHKSLHSLLEVTNLLNLLDLRFASSVDEALKDLRERLRNKSA